MQLWFRTRQRRNVKHLDKIGNEETTESIFGCDAWRFRLSHPRDTRPFSRVCCRYCSCHRFFLDASLDDWCWFVGCIGAVIATESINSSIERLANRVSMEHHDLIRDAKDLAAGAVLVVSVASAVIGMMRMYPLS